MKSKHNKLAITVLSIVAFGLSAAGLQAQDGALDPAQIRDRLQAGQTMVRPELSEELQALVDDFRAKRAELLAAHRANHSEARTLIAELRAQYENTELNDEQKAEIRAQLVELKTTHATEIRAMRQQLREEMRAIREQIREQRSSTEG